MLIHPLRRQDRPAYAQAADAIAQRRRAVLVTMLQGKPEPALSVCCQELDVEVALPDAAAEAVQVAARDRSAMYFAARPEAEDATEGLAEALLPAPLLLIGGGGHVGQALAAQAALAGFQVVVIDDRAECAQESLYPPGATVRCARFADAIRDYRLDEDAYIALVGRGHGVDAEALAACIGQPVAYIGMMGSRRKVALLRSEFIASGKATAEQFDRVHAPIGIQIGAQTVSEIAVSIVAELIAARRAGQGAPARGSS